MISECTKSDTSKILLIINDASLRYKGIVPDNCWHEPYMSEQELIDEFSDGVHMFGYHDNNKLIGVIGIQEVKDVILIRHAYTLTSHQGKGKIKNKSLQKILEGSNCLDKKVYKVFITCFADEFRNFEIYRNSDLLNKRRIETIMINAQFLTRSHSEVYVVTKEKMKEDKTYTSEDGFDFFFTMMDRLGGDYFIKQKNDISWEKVITFIIIAIIVAYVAKGLLKSSGSGSTASSSSSSAASSSGSSLSTSGVAAKGSFGTNMFRYAPANSVLHKPWFKYTFARGGFF